MPPPFVPLQPLPLKAAHPHQAPLPDPAPDEQVLYHLRGTFRAHLKDLPMDPPGAPTLPPRLLDGLNRLQQGAPSFSASTTDPDVLHQALAAVLQPTGMGPTPEDYATARDYTTKLGDQEQMVMWLIAQGAVPALPDLAAAAGNGNPRLVKRVLRAMPAELRAGLNAPHPQGISLFDPLHELAVSNAWSTVPTIIDDLLAAGVPLERPDVNHGRTALHWAARNNRLDVVHALLERGADPNRGDHAGHTAVHVAAWANHADVLHLLLAAGGDPARVAQPSDRPVPPDRGAPMVRRLGFPLPHETGVNPDLLTDTPILQAADNGASATLGVLMAWNVEPFPPVRAQDPASPRNRRALDLALENQRFQERGTSRYEKQQAAVTVQQLEQHWLRLELTAIAGDVSPTAGAVVRERPRL